MTTDHTSFDTASAPVGRPTTNYSLIAGLLLAAAATAFGAANDSTSNWPQWRGPLANGVAPSGNPPTTWSETENVKWKIKLPGAGTGTPIIWGNQIFIQAAIPTGKKVEPAAENKPAANFSPNVFGQAAPPTPATRIRRPHC